MTENEQAVKEQVKELIYEMEKDEIDEIKTEQETQDLIDQLESQQDKTASSSTTTTKTQQGPNKETQQIITQLEQDEIRVEQETEELIQRVEELKAAAEKIQAAMVEPSSPGAARAKEPTSDFIAQLRARLKADQDYVSLLEYQQRNKLPMDVGEKDFLTLLKERVESNKEFKALYDDFLSRLKGGL